MNKDKILSALKNHKRALLLAALAVGTLVLFIPRTSGGEEEHVSLSEYERELEEELEDMLSMIEGVGKCSVNVTFSDGERYEYSGSRIVSVSPPRVLGVGVVCEGGGSGEVSERITDAVGALFDIGANRISVTKMKK